MALSLPIGVFSMLLVCFGALQPFSVLQKVLFLSGAIGMTTTAVMERHRFLMILQCFVIVGTSLAFFDLNNILKSCIILIPCSAVVPWLIANHELDNKSGYFALGGLITVSLGFAISHPLIYFIGSLFLTTYSLLQIKQGIKIAGLWFALNLTFILTALYGYFH